MLAFLMFISLYAFFFSDRTLYQLRHQNNEDADEPTRFQRAPSKRMPEKKKIVEPEVPYVEPVTGKYNPYSPVHNLCLRRKIHKNYI